MKPARLLVSCLALGALAGCGNTVHHYPAQPLPEPAVVEAEEGQEEVVEEEVVEEVVEVEQDESSVVYVEIDVTPDYHRKLRGPAVFNFNTGYVDGWGAASIFNRGRPLADHQVDRLIQVGRRQGDPTGKLGLPGYEEGYRAGARQYRNPFRHRMTLAQVNQLRRAQGLPERTLVVRPGRGLRNETHVHVDARDNDGRDRDHKPRWNGTPGRTPTTDAERAARKAELENARVKAETQRKELEAAQLKRETDRLKALEDAKKERELARDQREAARDQRDADRKAKLENARKEREAEQKKQEMAKAQREAELKARLEAAKAQREAERKERELALDAKEAERKAELEQNKKDRDAKRDLRTATRKQKTADRKETLAERKKQRDAEKDAKDKEKAEASARD